MEQLASEIGDRLKIKIEVFGFDSGEGLPTHSDYRDLPYVWRRGFYKMDVAGVRRRLKNARLVLGDVRETVPAFIHDGAFPPIGFVSIDLDYYSSTVSALRVFHGPDGNYLPRVLLHLDDIMSGDQQYSCEVMSANYWRFASLTKSATRHHRIRPIHGWKRESPASAAVG